MSGCGTGNDGTKEDLMPRKAKYDRDNLCLRCKTQRGKLVIRHCAYCKDCFFPMVMMKFRKALEPVINPPGKPRSRVKQNLEAAGDLCLGFSGGIGSRILLDMVNKIYLEEWNEVPGSNERGGTMKPHRPPVWKRIRVVYVEACEAYEGVASRVEDARRVVEQYPGFEFVPLRLEDAFDDTWWREHGEIGRTTNLATSEQISPSLSIAPKIALRQHLDSLPTLTAVHYSINNLIRLLLQFYALSVGSSHVLLGSSLTTLSIALISGISQGGGFLVKEEKEESWKGLRIVRPLRDVGAKECAAWLWWRSLNIIVREESLGDRKSEAHSIQRLTRDFIVGLERDFPSTVSTITRTCDKLEPKGRSNGLCAICQRPSQVGHRQWREQISMRVLTEGGAPPRDDSDSQTPLNNALCYPCNTALTSRSSRTRNQASQVGPIPLPLWSAASIDEGPDIRGKPTKMTQEDMESRISGFLIDS